MSAVAPLKQVIRHIVSWSKNEYLVVVVLRQVVECVLQLSDVPGQGGGVADGRPVLADHRQHEQRPEWQK